MFSNKVTTAGFSVIYQTYLKPGTEEAYTQSWHVVASYFKARRGALGSCLSQLPDGRILAFSRWPDEATRNKSWPGENAPSTELPQEVRDAILVMKQSADDDRNERERVEREIRMSVVEDLFGGGLSNSATVIVAREDGSLHNSVKGIFTAYNLTQSTTASQNTPLPTTNNEVAVTVTLQNTTTVQDGSTISAALRRCNRIVHGSGGMN